MCLCTPRQVCTTSHRSHSKKLHSHALDSPQLLGTGSWAQLSRVLCSRVSEVAMQVSARAGVSSENSTGEEAPSEIRRSLVGIQFLTGCWTKDFGSTLGTGQKEPSVSWHDGVICSLCNFGQHYSKKILLCYVVYQFLVTDVNVHSKQIWNDCFRKGVPKWNLSSEG